MDTERAARALGNVMLLTLAPSTDLDLRPYEGAVASTVRKENEELLDELRAEVFGKEDRPDGTGLTQQQCERILALASKAHGLKPLSEPLSNADVIAYLVALEREDMQGGGPVKKLVSELADIAATIGD